MSLSHFRTPKMLIAAGLIVAGGAFLVACGVGQTPTAATSVAREIDTAGGGSVGALGANTLAICHLNDTGAFVPLQINPSAWGGHEKHGDGKPGGPSPASPPRFSLQPARYVDACPCADGFEEHTGLHSASQDPSVLSRPPAIPLRQRNRISVSAHWRSTSYPASEIRCEICTTPAHRSQARMTLRWPRANTTPALPCSPNYAVSRTRRPSELRVSSLLCYVQVR